MHMAYYKKDLARIKRFSIWLRETATKSGYESQRRLAKVANIDASTISRVWNAMQLPDEKTIAKIAAAFGMEISAVMVAAGYSGKESETDSGNATKTETSELNIKSEFELTNILRLENAVTYMGIVLTEQDIIETRHMIEMNMKKRLPAIIPIYPPLDPSDFDSIPHIDDIDPGKYPLPNAFFDHEGVFVNRYKVLQAEGHIKTDEEWKHTIINRKYNMPDK